MLTVSSPSAETFNAKQELQQRETVRQMPEGILIRLQSTSHTDLLSTPQSRL